jgi:hypothetical protein
MGKGRQVALLLLVEAVEEEYHFLPIPLIILLSVMRRTTMLGH